MKMNDNMKIIDEHPDHDELGCIAEGNASQWLRNQVMGHIKMCDSCRFVLSELVMHVDDVPDLVLPADTSSPINLKIVEGKEADEALVPKEERAKRPWRYPGDTLNLWISGSLFFLSLLITKYQVHFIVAAAFFGFLAAIDYSHRNIFTPLIDAWRTGDEEKASEAIQKLRDRFKIG